MTGLWQTLVVAVLVLETLAIGAQSPDVAKVLADVRAALGGSALAGVKTLVVEGTRARLAPDGPAETSPFQMAMELPFRFARKDVVGNVNDVDITRTSGFNGDEVIERADMPPGMAGGGRSMMVMRMGPGGMAGGEATPEERAAQRVSALLAARRDFARLALGMFGAGPEVYPLEFAYAGTAESPDATAHVLAVTSRDGFEARLYVHSTTHLPLMITWMDREPLMVTAGGPGRGGGQMAMRGASPEEAQRMRAEMEQRMREAEANRRTVEYRLFYADYKTIDGVKVPTRLQRMIDGSPVDELRFDTIVVNGPVDAKMFEISR